jgi:N-acetylglucosamine-6-sulfatase
MMRWAIALLAMLALVSERAVAADRPNIVFILMDDMRWDCMSLVGHPFIKTPNLDRIGREGALFKNGMVTIPLCSPARATFFTGTYAHKHGIIANTAAMEAPSHKLDTYHSHLQKSGYETAAIGKWHMGSDPTPRPGFDHWAVFRGQGKYDDCPFNINGKMMPTKGYVTDVISDMAVDFIKKDHAGKPFSLYVGHKAVHGPFTPAERHANLFADEKLPQAPSVNDPLTKKSGILRGVEMKDKGHPAYGVSDDLMRNQLRCIVSVDEGVGKILKALEETGQLDNTFIIFTSDNGFFWNEHKLGDKRAAYEESIRVPMVARYPKLIKAGTTIDCMVLDIDFAPTFLELAQAQSKPATLHGRSMLPLFAGGSSDWRKSAMFEYFFEAPYPNVPTWHAVRTDDGWKYIHYDEAEGVDELYNLKDDPYELKNLIDDPAAAEELKEMKAELAKLLAGAN